MPKPKKMKSNRASIRQADFSGGLNDIYTPALINNNEVSAIKNFNYDDKGALKLRGGITKRYTNPLTEPILNMYPYYKQDGTTRLVMGTTGKLYYDLPQQVNKFDSKSEFNTGAMYGAQVSDDGKVSIKTPDAATFVRNSVAYNEAGLQVPANTPRYVEKKTTFKDDFQSGIFTQTTPAETGALTLYKNGSLYYAIGYHERNFIPKLHGVPKYAYVRWDETHKYVKNLLTANQSNIETDTSGWSENSGGTTMSRDTVNKYEGTGCLKVVCSGVGSSEGVYVNQNTPISASSGEVISGQCRVKGTAGVILQLNARAYNSSGALLAYAPALTRITLDGTWQLVKVEGFTLPTNTAKVDIYVVCNNIQSTTFYIDDAQIEKNPTCGTWVVGGTSTIDTVGTTSCQYSWNNIDWVNIGNGGVIAGIETHNLMVETLYLKRTITSTDTNYTPKISNFQVVCGASTPMSYNLFSADQSNFETGTTGVYPNGNHTISRITTDKYAGSACLQVVSTGVGNGANTLTFANASVVAGQPYVFSFYAKSVSGSKSLHCAMWGDMGAKDFVLTSEWARYSITTFYWGGTGLFLWLNDSGTFLIDNLQFEPNPIATEWVTGGTWAMPSDVSDRVLQIEAGTTNLLMANPASVETDTSGFASFAGGVISRDTSDKYSGNASLKVVTQANTPYSGVNTSFITTACIPGYTYSAQTMIKGTAGYQIAVFLQAQTSGGIWNGQQFVIITLTGAWQRVTVDNFVAPAGTAYLNMVICYTSQPPNASITFNIDCLQIENRSCPTSWVLGGASRSDECINNVSSSVLNASVGEISGTFKLNALRPIATKQYQSILSTRDNTTGAPNPRFLIMVDNMYNRLYVFESDGASILDLNPSGILEIDREYEFCYQWSTTLGRRLYFDGALVASNTNYKSLLDVGSGSINLGAWGTDCPLHGTLQNLRISDEWHDVTTPSTADPVKDTITRYLALLHGNLSATGLTRWVSPAIDVTAITDKSTGVITWVADTTLAGTAVALYTHYTTDGATWSDYVVASNNSVIGVPNGATAVQVKAYLITTNSNSPTLDTVTLSFKSTSQPVVISDMTDSESYTFAVYMDKLYITNGVDALKRWDGTTLSDVGGSPPRAKYVILHKNMLFLSGDDSNQDRLYFSGIGDPDAWATLDFIDFRTTQGDKITGLAAYQNNLIIFKNNSIHALQGDGKLSFVARQIVNDVGCVAPLSIVSISDGVSFVGIHGIYFFNGYKASLASIKVQSFWDTQVNKKYLHKATSLLWDNKLYVAVPTGASTVNDTVLVFDIIRAAWTIYKGWTPSCFTMYREYNQYFCLMGTQAGHVYAYDATKTTDDGTAIDFDVVLKTLDFGAMEVQKRYRQVFVDTSNSATYKLAFIVDGTSSSEASVEPLANGKAMSVRQIIPSQYGVGLGRLITTRIYGSATSPLTVYGVVTEAVIKSPRADSEE